MKLPQLKKRVRIYAQWIPFTGNTLIFAIIYWALFRFLHQPITKENTSDAQLPFVRLMGAFVAWLFIGLVLLSVLSSLIAWLHFLWLRQKNKSGLQVHFYTENKNDQKRQFIEASLPHSLRPILGFVKARLYYDDGQLTDKFAMLSSKLKIKSLLREAIMGKSRIELLDIKEYQIKGGMIFFEDLLNIVSLPVQQNLGGNFYQAPDTLAQTSSEFSPKHSNSMDVRIEQLRKVEGDLLQYKSFEAGDDVRRIVWKVFAKNRALVVRIPERMEPYASKLNFYASFYNSIGKETLYSKYFAEMLNTYKHNVWSIYNALQQKEWQVKYIPDQTFQLSETLAEQERNERIISNSQWQNEYPTSHYFSTKKGTVLVISSLCKANDIAQIMDEADNSLQIFYVPLSQIFKQNVGLHWLSNILFTPAPDRLSGLKSKWIFSPLRRQLIQNEKEIERLLR
jgi:hypothetical protein